jgi:hypothetical protein
MNNLSGLIWRKSSRSNGSGGNNCVEVAFLDGGTTLVRDSKAGDNSPILTFTPAEWDAFLGGAKAGEFDR